MKANVCIVSTYSLHRTEYMQDAAKVSAIVAAMGSDLDAICWEDQPTIIIDEDNSILDGQIS